MTGQRTPAEERFQVTAKQGKTAKATAQNGPRGHNYCWTEHPRTSVHCTEPTGHPGSHWHTYTKTRWE